MSGPTRSSLRDAPSAPSALSMRRRGFLANLARLAGGALAGSLPAGSSLAADSVGAQSDGWHAHDSTPLGVGSRAGYYPTIWPSEHTDLWRSHAVLSAGLPADVATRQLHVTTASLNLPVWGYTRASGQVFVIGGSPFLLDYFTRAIENGSSSGTNLDLGAELHRQGRSIPYVARVDTHTMQVRRFEMQLGHTLNYTGGLLMHQNGFVYAVAQSVLYKINPRTMQAVDFVHLPLVGTNTAEGFFTTYNGMQ